MKNRLGITRSRDALVWAIKRNADEPCGTEATWSARTHAPLALLVAGSNVELGSVFLWLFAFRLPFPFRWLLRLDTCCGGAAPKFPGRPRSKKNLLTSTRPKTFIIM